MSDTATVNAAFITLLNEMKTAMFAGDSASIALHLPYMSALESLQRTYSVGEPVGGAKTPGAKRGRKPKNGVAVENAVASGEGGEAVAAEAAVEAEVATEGRRRQRA